MRRVEVASDAGLSLTEEQNLELQRIVAKKTDELEAQHDALAATLGELKKTQSKLLQAQKLEAIGALAAGIAHEINTPTQYVSDNAVFLQRSFTKVIGLLEESKSLLAEAQSGAVSAATVERVTKTFKDAKLDFLLKQVPRALEQSREGLSRVGTIVSAMKEFSHPSSGEKAPIDLREAILSTITVASNEWKYVAELETDFDASMPLVCCLRDQVNQVVLNLIVNASHAVASATENGAKGKGKIRIETRHVDGMAEIVVRDTGCGIPKKNAERVFDPFFTTKPVGQGTGQGLAIAYSVIVERHGGQLTFDSEENVGTTFYIRLPMVPTPDEGSPRSRQ
jgi:two-component system NtrC family sensor kinase